MKPKYKHQTGGYGGCLAWIILIAAIIYLYSCNRSKSVPDIIDRKYDSLNTMIGKLKTQLTINDSTLQGLLITYYKAGWMAGSNGVIDLHNMNNLDNKTLQILRDGDWRRIEQLVKSKAKLK